MDALTIRPATSDDLDQLCRLVAQLSDHLEVPDRVRSAAALEAILSTPSVQLFVAEQEGRVVGTVTLAVVPNLTHGGRPWAQLENMVVDSEARSGGIGRSLLDGALRRAREAGCYKVQLQSANARADAHRFYEREGFSASSKGYRLYFDG